MINEREPHYYQAWLAEREHRRIFPQLYFTPIDNRVKWWELERKRKPAPNAVQSGRERLGE